MFDKQIYFMSDSLTNFPEDALPYAFGTKKHVPFKAYLRYPPFPSGRKWETLRDKQKIVRRLENELVSQGWNIATPISYDLGLSGLITLIGFYELDRETNPNYDPLTQATRIHPGSNGDSTSLVTGHAAVNGGLTDDRRITTGGTGEEGDFATEVSDFYLDLINVIAVANPSIQIQKIEYNEIRFGKTAPTLP